jgi:hypothetical protein
LVIVIITIVADIAVTGHFGAGKHASGTCAVNADTSIE